MFSEADLKKELIQLRNKTRKEEGLVSEAKRILKEDLFTDKNVLDHLKQYNKSFETLDEEDLHDLSVFSIREIKQIAIRYRLKFLESHLYKREIPYEATLKINELNKRYHKEINNLKVLATHDSFKKQNAEHTVMLFAKTNYDNYYLVHSWGKPFKVSRKLLFLPLRNFETLVITVVLTTLLIALVLPTRLITLDHKATYWSGYRAAAFFHLLIFNFGVTVYFTFAFARNLSSSVWNSYKDF